MKDSMGEGRLMDEAVQAGGVRLVQVFNRQRTKGGMARRLAAAGQALLGEFLALSEYEVAVHLVGPKAMARMNQEFLSHQGPTDVITFDHRERAGEGRLCGEIYICVAVAVAQAGHYGTTWWDEVLRYLVHGVLHLQGLDDLDPASRRVMKRAEGRLLRRLRRRVGCPEV